MTEPLYASDISSSVCLRVLEQKIFSEIKTSVQCESRDQKDLRVLSRTTSSTRGSNGGEVRRRKAAAGVKYQWLPATAGRERGSSRRMEGKARGENHSQ